MNPSKPGWLSDYIAHKSSVFAAKGQSPKSKLGKHPDQSFYGIIQPTGIMYGYPVGTFGIEGESDWADEDKIKIVLAESFLSIAELYNGHQLKNESDFSEFCEKALLSVAEFYRGVYPDLNVTYKNWFGKRKSPYSVVEKVLEKRIDLINKSNTNFWSGFFSKSQLFLDVYIFGQWTYTHPDSVLLDFFRGEKEDLSFNSVKVIAAAAHANKKIEQEERDMFEHFIGTITLPAEKRRVAQEYFEHGIGIQELPIEESDPWIIRKFFLELATLTILSDKKIEQIEKDFLESFNESLGFSNDDDIVSLIAVEGFLLQNWAQLDQLQGKINYESISKDYMQQLSKIASIYDKKIGQKILNSEILASTINKGSVSELSDTDKKLIKTKLLAILQSIPEFRVIILPDVFLSYEKLLKVIPREVITRVLTQQ